MRIYNSNKFIKFYNKFGAICVKCWSPQSDPIQGEKAVIQRLIQDLVRILAQHDAPDEVYIRFGIPN